MDSPDASQVITTIIPTYQRPRLLRRAIRSALGQTYRHVRVAVYDNASGDDTRKVVEELARGDDRVRYHGRPENLGPMRNIASAMEEVETPFFSILSDDDLLFPGCYRDAMEGFRRHPQAGFSSTAVAHVHERHGIITSPGFSWPAGLHSPPEGLRKMLKYGHPAWTGIVFRRELVREIGTLDLDVGVIGDLDFELRAAAHGPFVTTRIPGAVFFVHSESASAASTLLAGWKAWSRLVGKHLREDIRGRLEWRARRWLLHKFFGSIARGNREEAAAGLELVREAYPSGRGSLPYRGAVLACRAQKLLSRPGRAALTVRERLARSGQSIPTDAVLRGIREAGRPS